MCWVLQEGLTGTPKQIAESTSESQWTEHLPPSRVGQHLAIGMASDRGVTTRPKDARQRRPGHRQPDHAVQRVAGLVAAEVQELF